MTLRQLNIYPLLKKYGIKPKKSLGQNFLVEPSGLNKVIEAAELTADDDVLEIGAGLGSLTFLLAQTARQVVAVEIDRGMMAPLREALAKFENVRIVEGDILALKPDELMQQQDYVVVANIPYYISSAIIRHLMEAQHKPKRVVLTVQKEVAERVLARDGKMSLLSLSVQVFGEVSIAGVIPAGSFLPAPDVDSAVLRIDLYPEPLVSLDKQETFFKLAHAGFGQKRKTLRNSLSAGLALSVAEVEKLLSENGINPQRRAETLSILEWKKLTEAFLADS
ncbi:MAG: 16S rRNA (adenine(1518)-N(6)/adenine(1519)-N(6))-dimethyltransferase RsmA [Anaerolineaceae bacterium]|jgi:16S rRNA (adenine1518-N6/adenine1519-N6)-dimethyltransferase|nr:16S rRNA (adenine(1518)-N(6)/adenine(1519)-N(6))-dimethyltransferase RsmA [Anaerolineaceae bacterium]MDD4042307.1 16S rRNA (adenine(1518)-N(6)/adenine(1519)-N(6))-dimethyltransferase RsmA [Anaerolineaceae bacterium]MDD4578292.1 16S rRNA (adenine(1518)-N(6)/adenine(1519)-N(6))-dimethyltransferase RsmA [Anaerolineaceae bacterium]